MYRIGVFAADMLNSIDNVAKETLEEPKESSTIIRMKKKNENISNDSLNENEEQSKIKTIITQSSSSESLPNNEILSPESVKSTVVDKDLQKIISKKNKEIEKLNTECLELETQCESLKLEVKEAWEAYKGAQEKAIIRETELLDEIKELEKAKSTDRQSMVARLQQLETTQQNTETEIKRLQKENCELLEKMQTMEIETTHWKEEEFQLRNELHEAKLNSNQNLDGLREELRLSEATIEKLRNDYSIAIRQSNRRQEELEDTNSDLVRNLIEKDREILRLQQINEKNLISELNNSQIDEYLKQIEMGKNTVEELKFKLENKQKEILSLNLNYNTEKDILTNEIKNLNKIIQNLNSVKSESDNMSNLESELNNKNIIIQQNEKQLKNLGLQLLKKEELITELLSERNGYKIRLNDSQQRCNVLEKQLKLIMNNENISPYSGTNSISSTSSTSSSNISDMSKLFDEEISKNYNEEYMIEKLQKQINNNKIVTEFEKLGIKNNSKISQFLNFVDVSTYSMGRYLKTNPLLRLVFIIYFLVLHIYIFILVLVQLYLFDIEE